MNLKSWYSRASDNWATPRNIYKFFMDRGCYDPCPINAEKDGLSIEWKERNFVNPPYSQLKKWVIKSIEEHKKGHAVTLLIPARTDTQAFKLLFEYGAIFTFITGRLAYNETGKAPFPSMLVTLTGWVTTIERIERDYYDYQ